MLGRVYYISVPLPKIESNSYMSLIVILRSTLLTHAYRLLHHLLYLSDNNVRLLGRCITVLLYLILFRFTCGKCEVSCKIT